MVWESRRPSGTDQLKYRIWMRGFDGRPPRMISGLPDREGVAHFGARISPDGRHVAFASLRWNSHCDSEVTTIYSCEYPAAPFDAWVVPVDPDTLSAGTPRPLPALQGRLGSGGENLLFTWKDPDTLFVVIHELHGVYEYHLSEDRIGARVADVDGEALVGPSGRSMISAQPRGAHWARLERAVEAERPLLHSRIGVSGCQVTVDAQDRLIAWANQPGEIMLLHLESRREHNLASLHHHLPETHRYLYFPALSRDGRVLAFGGGDVHSHAFGAYDIFLLALDPATAAPAGDPIRITFNDRARYPDADPEAGHALDRWPDVWTAAVAAAETHRQPPSVLDAALRLESIDPRAAWERWRALAADPDPERADPAAQRVEILRTSAAFQNELEAWRRWEQLTPVRERQDPADPDREQAQAVVLRLREDHPRTRARLEADLWAERTGLPLPAEIPESQRVHRTVTAIVREVSTPLSVEQVRPYTEAFAVVAYETETDGAETPERMIVLHMTMTDARALPGADLRPGDRVRLDLGPWAAQRHYREHPVSDEIHDLESDRWFALGFRVLERKCDAGE